MLKYVVLASISLVMAVSGALGVVRGDEPAASPARVVTDPLRPDAADPSAAVESLKAHVRRVPQDHTAWADLGTAYFQLAEVDLDAELFAEADRAIDRSLAISPNDNVRAMAARSAISASHHQFRDALEQADAVLALAPYDATALSIRIDALTQLGQFDELMPAVRQADRRQPGVGVASRWSYAVELTGRLDRARQILRGATVSANRAELEHLYTQVADLDRRQGDLAGAREALDLAEKAMPGSVDAMVGRALLAQARGNHDRALARWRDVVRRSPLPEHFLTMGELLDHLGRTAEAEDAYTRSVEAAELLADGGANVDGELAQLLVDHGDRTDLAEALARGRAEARRGRGVHASDAYAWALHANGRHREALRYSRIATRLGTREAILWIHRGTIEASLGLDAAARTHLRAGIAMDPGLSPWQLARARAELARLT